MFFVNARLSLLCFACQTSFFASVCLCLLLGCHHNAIFSRANFFSVEPSTEASAEEVANGQSCCWQVPLLFMQNKSLHFNKRLCKVFVPFGCSISAISMYIRIVLFVLTQRNLHLRNKKIAFFLCSSFVRTEIQTCFSYDFFLHFICICIFSFRKFYHLLVCSFLCLLITFECFSEHIICEFSLTFFSCFRKIKFVHKSAKRQNKWRWQFFYCSYSLRIAL